jgi:recombinational DNA repair protein RecR
MLAIENTQLFKGKYHILGGVISPIEGISLTIAHSFPR